MKLAQLIEGLGLTLIEGSADVDVVDLTDDSRQVQPGSLFIARQGTKEDGAHYIPNALARGAVAVVMQWDRAEGRGPRAEGGVGGEVAEWPSGPVAECTKPQATPAADSDITHHTSHITHRPTLLTAARVDQALAGQLAERFFGYPSRQLKLVGITGTNGKTTIAFIVQHLLRAAGVRCGVIGTVVIDDGAQRRPTVLTTPSAIDLSRMLGAMVANGCGAAVAEFSSHGLDQNRSAALDVDVAVFTNLTGDHLDYHDVMDAYAAAKAKLFEQLRPAAWAVVNRDDSFADRMLRDCRAKVVHCTLGDASAQDDQLAGITCSASIITMTDSHSVARFDGPWGSVETKLPLVGRYNVINVLQAIAAANCVASQGKHLRKALLDCPAPPGRLEPVRYRDPQNADAAAEQPTVLVDYAHTADALENVLLALRPVVKGKLITVFGCGGDRDRTKRPKMAAIAARLADRVFITSDNPRTEQPGRIIDEIVAGVGEGFSIFDFRFSIEGQEPPKSKIENRKSKIFSHSIVVEPDRAAAIELAILTADIHDTVLIAGKGHEDYQIIGETRFPFDDRIHAARALGLWLEQHRRPLSV